MALNDVPYPIAGNVDDVDNTTNLDGGSTFFTVKVHAWNYTKQELMWGSAIGNTTPTGDYSIDAANFPTTWANGDILVIGITKAALGKDESSHVIATGYGTHTLDTGAGSGTVNIKMYPNHSFAFGSDCLLKAVHLSNDDSAQRYVDIISMATNTRLARINAAIGSNADRVYQGNGKFCPKGFYVSSETDNPSVIDYDIDLGRPSN